MKRTVLVISIGVFAVTSSACAPVYGGGGLTGPRLRPCAQASVHRHLASRWDAVRALRPGSPIRVSIEGGAVLIGRLEHVGLDEIRVRAKATPVGVSVLDILRVDVLDNSAGAYAKRILIGAAGGAVLLGANAMFLAAVLGGKWYLPPARTWVVGAVAGAVYGPTELALSRGWRTIYMSPAAC